MRLKALAATAFALILIVAAPTAASAAVTHQASLAGSVASVEVDVETLNAGQQASVMIMRVGAKYSAPLVADIIFVNELTVDSAGILTFSATLPGGDLDDYVLSVNVAGATARYLASLDPGGPTPVEAAAPGTLVPAQGGGLAMTGTTIAIGLVALVAVAMLVVGAVLYLRRRRAAEAS